MNNTPSDPRAEPLVTIAIATYNSGNHLFASVRSVLDQTYRNIEIIVVDDGSTDGSLAAIEAIEDPRLRVLHQPNQGKSVALNLIRAEANGDYLAIHDGDDESHPDRIRRQVAVMEADPELGACFSRHDLLLDGRRFAARRLELSKQECGVFIDEMSIPAIDPTGLYRTAHTVDVDYEPKLRIGQGVDYILRVGERHPICVMGDSLYSYRIVADSTTRRSPIETHRYIEEVRRRACERRNVTYEPTPAPPESAKAQHAFFGHILEASIENALAGDRLETAKIAYQTLRYAGLGLDGLKPALVVVLPSLVLRRMRPKTHPASLR